MGAYSDIQFTAQRDFVVNDRVKPIRCHNDQHGLGYLAAELDAEARCTHRVKGRIAPLPALAFCEQYPAAAFAANEKTSLQKGRDDEYAFRLAEISFHEFVDISACGDFLD